MTRAARLLPALGLLVAASLDVAGAAAADPARLELETQAWYADNGQDSALLWGPELTLGPRADLALRAHWWQGSFNPGGDLEDVEEWRVCAGWRRGAWEAGAGYAGIRYHTDLQPGWAWSYPTEEAERNADIHGPLAYARGAGRWGDSPLGWRIGGAWLVRDFGDFDDLGYDGAFLEVEAALTLERERWRAGAGYRYRAYRDLPARAVEDERLNRETVDGLFAFLSFRL